MSRRGRLRRSSGSALTPGDMIRLWRPGRREAASAADIAAIDRGEGRSAFCEYRGLYGSYPRRFMGCWLDLTPEGPVIRPLLFLRWGQRIPVEEPVLSARVRPFVSKWEAINHLGAGEYAPGGSLEQSGHVVISCQTTGGVLEFAVRRPDVALMLHYFSRLV